MPYCHGSAGTAGRAPQLAGRTFTAGDLFAVILGGKPGTSMPAFSQQLKSDDIKAVTQYILSLAGPSEVGGVSSNPAVAQLPPEAKKGQALFFDAVRMGGCGKCHEVDDRGSPVGPDLSTLTPARFHNLRAAAGTRVVTASITGEDPFPALVAEQTPERIQVYDLPRRCPCCAASRRHRFASRLVAHGRTPPRYKVIRRLTWRPFPAISRGWSGHDRRSELTTYDQPPGIRRMPCAKEA